MDIGDFLVITLLYGVAFVFLIIGIYIRMGYLKRWHFRKIYNPVLTPPTSVFIFIPASLMVFALALASSLPISSIQTIILYAMGVLFLGTMFFSVWQPWWLKPAWYRWLEKEYADVFVWFAEDVQKDPKGWEKMVRTQEGLKVWADGVRERIQQMQRESDGQIARQNWQTITAEIMREFRSTPPKEQKQYIEKLFWRNPLGHKWLIETLEEEKRNLKRSL